jgi:two-component system, chemotaxis family, protein-glutamate methylesterase/glutaminase
MSLNVEVDSRVRVLVVDDSAFMRTALSRMIACEPDMEVVGTACCASIALEKVSDLDPDVVTLDLAMPGLDGLGTLRRIMHDFPRPVIMVSATTEKDAEITLQALSAGAFDYVPKQLSEKSLEIAHIRDELITKIRAAAQLRRRQTTLRDSRKPPRSTQVETRSSAPVMVPSIVSIGISTGGPRALEQLLPRFPANFPVPILIVQHMPFGYTTAFAQRLDSFCSIKVKEAAQGELIRPATAYIAPAGLHMRVVTRLSDSKPAISLDKRPENAMHIPSADELMISVAQVFKNRAIGVIMTGMGADGAAGMTAIFRAGGITIGQDEASCAVYGMPRVCAQLGVLTHVLSLSHIPVQIIKATRQRKRA